MDLTTLVRRCRQGDPLAWETLVRRFQGRVYGLAYHYLGNAEEARDLAQDVFVRIYTRLETCTNEETFVPWMIRIARNLCIDRMRRLKARPQAVGTPVDEMTHLASGHPGPEERFDSRFRRSLVRRALAKLGGVSREIIILKDMQGLALEEIAKMLNLPIGTVKSRSNRARIQLAREILAITGEPVEAGDEGPTP